MTHTQTGGNVVALTWRRLGFKPIRRTQMTFLYTGMYVCMCAHSLKTEDQTSYISYGMLFYTVLLLCVMFKALVYSIKTSL